jgi:hypothetical protein
MNKKFAFITMMVILVFLCVFVIDVDASQAFDFFSPTGFTSDELETLSAQFDYSNVFNILNEYEFFVYRIKERIRSVNGFCVANNSIYVSDNRLSRILVFNMDFQKKDTIRNGSLNDFTFSPRGICQDFKRNLAVLTDVNNLTRVGRLITYNERNEYVGERSFRLDTLNSFDMLDDVIMTNTGALYFTIISDTKENGKIYQVINNDVIGIGNESFGHLCLTVDGEDILFVNGRYSLNDSSIRLRGMPALYKMNGSAIKHMTMLPAIQRIPSGKNEATSSIDNFSTYLVDASYGFQGLCKSGNEYIVLTRLNPTLYVFDQNLEYSRTIPLPLKDIVANAGITTDKNELMCEVVCIDASDQGELFLLANIHASNDSSSLIGIRAIPKHD